MSGNGHGFSCPVCSNPMTLGDGDGQYVELDPPADPDAEAREKARRTAIMLRRIVIGFLLVMFGEFVASIGAH